MGSITVLNDELRIQYAPNYLSELRTSQKRETIAESTSFNIMLNQCFINLMLLVFGEGNSAEGNL